MRTLRGSARARPQGSAMPPISANGRSGPVLSSRDGRHGKRAHRGGGLALPRAARRHPDVQPILASKATLVATSHLVEDLLARSPGRNLLLSGFQRGRNWAAERDRYLGLANGGEVIAVFAGREPPEGWGVDHVGIRLRDGDPLSQEWFVLALGPEVAVTLCGLDADDFASRSPQDGERLFEVVWSFDPGVARGAAEVVLDAVRESAPERVGEVGSALAGLALPDAAQAAAVGRGADHVAPGCSTGSSGCAGASAGWSARPTRRRRSSSLA